MFENYSIELGVINRFTIDFEGDVSGLSNGRNTLFNICDINRNVLYQIDCIYYPSHIKLEIEIWSKSIDGREGGIDLASNFMIDVGDKIEIYCDYNEVFVLVNGVVPSITEFVDKITDVKFVEKVMECIDKFD